jgi:hypothetical protein
MSSGGVGLLGVGDFVVDLAGDGSFEAAHDVLFGESFGGSAEDVGAGAFVVSHADEGHGVERVVGASVAAAVEAVAGGAAGGRGDGCSTGEVRERCFRAESFGVVPGSHQQLGGDVDTDPGLGQEAGSCHGRELGQGSVEFFEFLGQGEVPAGQGPQTPSSLPPTGMTGRCRVAAGTVRR